MLQSLQRRVLRDQTRLALALGQPIVIHDRSAGTETLEILIDEGAFDGRVLWHCFTGDVAYMRQIIDAGGYISIPGIVTFKNGQTTRDVSVEVPSDRLLIETDSPYLTPVPHRGTRNEPCRVVHVAETVAGLRRIDLVELAAITTENTRRFYGITS